MSQRPSLSSVGGLLLRLLGVLVLLSGMTQVAPGQQPDSQRVGFVTGRQLQRELDKPINIVLARSTPRVVVQRLRDLYGIALLLDRRIDPDQPLDVQLVQMTLREGLEMLAHQLDARVATIGSTILIGPGPSMDRLRTLIAVRTQQIRSAPAETADRRQFELLHSETFRWEDLAEPADLLSEVSAAFQLEISARDRLPHDLWRRGMMADVNAAEALSLLLGQFELAFEWEANGNAVRIVPMPEKLSYAGAHSPRKMSPEAAIALIREEWPHLQPVRSGRQIRVTATAAEHDAIEEQIAPQADPPATADAPTQGPLKNRRFTLTTTRAEAIAILRTLEAEAVTIEYDPAALQQAGVNLRTKLTLDLQQATADELLKAICEPLGLAYEITGQTARLRPR